MSFTLILGKFTPITAITLLVVVKYSILTAIAFDSFYREGRDSIHLALPGNVHLTQNQQKLTDEDVEIICNILKGNTYVRSIDLRYNRITDKGAEHLAGAIKV